MFKLYKLGRNQNFTLKKNSWNSISNCPVNCSHAKKNPTCSLGVNSSKKLLSILTAEHSRTLFYSPTIYHLMPSYVISLSSMGSFAS